MCCTFESTLSSEELFLEQAFPRKSIVSEDTIVSSDKIVSSDHKKVHVNEHD